MTPCRLQIPLKKATDGVTAVPPTREKAALCILGGPGVTPAAQNWTFSAESE